MLVEQQPAYLLHLRHYRDSSALVELLTPQHGRVGAVARGVFRSGRKSSQWRSLLQPFVPLVVGWSGRGELKSLREVDGRNHLPLKGERLYAGLYVNELTLRLLHRNDAHAQVFRDYAGMLGRLEGDEDLESCLRCYELGLLDALGYGVSLETEADSGQPIDDDAWYRFVPEHGMVRVVGDSASGAEPLLRGFDLRAMAQRDFEPAVLKPAKYLCRQLLRPLLGTEPLRSRALFQGKSQ